MQSWSGLMHSWSGLMHIVQFTAWFSYADSLFAKDESGYLQLDITGYPEDFNVSFNVTGTFLGFSKISAKVVATKDKIVQVTFPPPAIFTSCPT